MELMQYMRKRAQEDAARAKAAAEASEERGQMAAALSELGVETEEAENEN